MSPATPAQPDQSLIPRAPMRVTGLSRMHYHPEQDAPPATPPATPPAKPDDKGDDIESRIQARVDAALEKERKATAEKAAKEQEERDRKAAEEQGKWKELAEKERLKREEAESHNLRLRQEAVLSEHLATDHPDYVTCKRYIAPLIPADADGDELTKAVKAAVADYVKDNPREKKGTSAGAPNTRGTARVPATRVPNQPVHQRPSPGVASSRF